jgi:hypothetical protein
LNQKRYMRIRRQNFKEADAVTLAKQDEYIGGKKDVFATLKAGSNPQGLPAYTGAYHRMGEKAQRLGVLLSRYRQTGKGQAKIHEEVIDITNYLQILDALVTEEDLA